jgi:periplasmic protein TonB
MLAPPAPAVEHKPPSTRPARVREHALFNSVAKPRRRPRAVRAKTVDEAEDASIAEREHTSAEPDTGESDYPSKIESEAAPVPAGVAKPAGNAINGPGAAGAGLASAGGGGAGIGSGSSAGKGSGGDGGGTGGGVGEGAQIYATVEHPPVPISRILPEYPGAARSQGVEGEVVLRAIVDQRGTVEPDVVVVQSVPLLDRAAVEALRQWRFEPGRDGGNRAVRVVIEVPLRFRLR